MKPFRWPSPVSMCFLNSTSSLRLCSPWVQSKSIKSIVQPVPFKESQRPYPVWGLMTCDGVNHTRHSDNHPDVHNFSGILSKSASHYRIVDKDEVARTPWPNWNWKPLKHGREIHSYGETDRLFGTLSPLRSCRVGYQEMKLKEIASNKIRVISHSFKSSFH